LLSVFLCACHGAPDNGMTDGGGPPDETGNNTVSNIKHLVVIIQENHTFDNYFGLYCQAPTGSSPTCNSGPTCCEAAPSMDPGTGTPPTPLTDAENGSYDPDHYQNCETDEIDGGKMDQFVSSKICGSAQNFSLLGADVGTPYWNLASSSALADRYFQPVVGASSSNDMYFARANFVFPDNEYVPTSLGSSCDIFATGKMEFLDKIIGDVLVAGQASWAFYIEGYQAMLDTQMMGQGQCPDAPSDCPAAIPFYPCIYDPSDIPMQYYPTYEDNPTYMRDFARLQQDLQMGKLPGVNFVKGLGYKSEHPGTGTTISDGITFVTGVIDAVQNSAYAQSTLILLTYDEGGGHFDHVTPPPPSSVDGQAYGTRVPLLAIGPFARKNFVSHVTMEHSSVVKFIEWNWLSEQTGQLGTRDKVVNNLGSLLDPAVTGVEVPSQ
jgi:phospholipase C